MKKIKHILLPSLFLLIFVIGVGRSVIFLKSSTTNQQTLRYSTSQPSSDNLPFFFQPIEDVQNEDDDHLSVESDLHNRAYAPIIFTNYSRKSFKHCKQSTIEQRLWCLHSNFRL